MFLEPRLKNTSHKKGWIEVICGSMFSGKTEELIRRITRARIANLRVEIYKPAVDKRYHETEVVSHNSNAGGRIFQSGDVVKFRGGERHRNRRW